MQASSPPAGHRRLLVHVALAALVVAGTIALTRTEGVVSADESAMLAQLDLLERTGEWTAPNPEPTIDPSMASLPLELSDRTADGRWAPFAKHPVHITLLRPLWALGGYGGALGASVLGVALAAWSAARLAVRLRPGTGAAAVWATAAGSPLLFDGHQVVGHALGAGFVGAAAVACVVATEGRGRRRFVGLSAVALAVALAVAVRSEAILAGLALGGAFGVVGLLRRDRSAIVAGATCGAATIAAWLGEHALVASILGSGSSTGGGSAPAASGGLEGRWSSFRLTVLDASYLDGAAPGLLWLAVLLGSVGVAAWLRRGHAGALSWCAAGSALSAVAWLAADEFLVPGLVPATPMTAFGATAALLGRRPVPGGAWSSSSSPQALALGAALFVAAVALSQYEAGGGGEWGGRYFALGLPVILALCCATLHDALADLPHAVRRTAWVAAAVVVGALSVGAVRTIGDARDASRAVADGVVDLVEPADVDVVVNTRPAVGRFARATALDGRRWLTVLDEAEVAPLLDALRADGVARVAVLARADERGGPPPTGWRIEDQRSEGSLLIRVLTLADAP